MQALAQYASDSDDEDAAAAKDNVQLKAKARVSLPSAAQLLGIQRPKSIGPEVDASGRIRSFAHVEGNWPSSIFIEVDVADSILQAARLSSQSIMWKWFPAADVHISLSKAFVLRHHQIDSFVDDLFNRLKTARR